MAKTQEDTTYNGCENWDTWNVRVWLTNDEDTYHAARSVAWRWNAESLLRELATETGALTDGVDFNAVNWEEVVEAVTDE